MRSILSSLCLVFTFVAAPSLAATKVWSSRGTTTNLWSDPANWQGGVVPANGDRLVFPSGTLDTVQNDLSNLVLDGIDSNYSLALGTGLFILEGNAITLTGASALTAADCWLEAPLRFTNPNARMTIGQLPAFYGSLTIAGGMLTIDAPTADLGISGQILEEGPASVVVNARQLFLVPPNSFSGSLTVNALLLFTHLGSLGSASGGTFLTVPSFGVVGYGGLTFDEPLTFNGDGTFDFDASVLAGPISISGVQQFLPTSDVSIQAAISGMGRMVLPSGWHPVTLANSGNSFSGGLQVGGDLRAAQPDVIPHLGELVIEGGGRVDLATFAQGARRLSCAGTMAMSPGGSLHVDEASDITGCTLQLTFAPGYVAPASEIPIILNASSVPIMGTFIGMPEGTIVMVNGAVRYLSYSGGDGNDVVLRTTLGSPFPSAAPMVQDMWWSGTLENGWGMSILQHGNHLFGALYVYDALGKPTWYVMPAGTWNQAFDAYFGDIYSPRGSPFFQYDPGSFVPGMAVGNVAITFQNAVAPEAALLEYTIGGVTGRKTITRQSFGRDTAANVGAHGDMWWGNINQNGWGLAILQQRDTLFNVWFTYDSTGSPTWFVMPGGTWTATDTYEGGIYRTLGSPWAGHAYDASQLQVFETGPYRLRFTGDSATLDYSVDGRSGRLILDRQPF